MDEAVVLVPLDATLFKVRCEHVTAVVCGLAPDRSGTYLRVLTPKERYATVDHARRLCRRWLAQPAELRAVAAVLVEDGMGVADAMRAAALLSDG